MQTIFAKVFFTFQISLRISSKNFLDLEISNIALKLNRIIDDQII